MKIDTTEPERLFSILNTGLSTFVFNTLQEYESKLTILVEEIKKLREENEKHKKSIDALMGGTSE